jgi:prepilin-type processing-associated H-X9-DG protein
MNPIRAYSPNVGFGSAHPAGLQMAMCDGSVRVITYAIDWGTHRWLSNRHAGEV